MIAYKLRGPPPRKLNALACGATVLASDTPPVREVIEHEHTGLLADFFDVDGLVETANRVLDDPDAFRPLGRAGVDTIRERYSLDVCLPRIERLFRETAGPVSSPPRRQPESLATCA